MLLISSCVSTSEVAHDDDLRTLPGRFAMEPVGTPLAAVDALIGPNEFYISYESEDGIVYSGGKWSNRIDRAALDRYAPLDIGDRVGRGPGLGVCMQRR